MVAFPTRPGSVVVNHIVIISLLVTTQTQEKLQNVTKNLKEEIHAVVAQQNCTNGTCEPPSKGMGRSWATHGVGDSFPPTRNLTATPGSGLWGMSCMFPLLQTSCASTPPTWWSATVRSTSTKRVSGWGCPIVGDAARFRVAGIPPKPTSLPSPAFCRQNMPEGYQNYYFPNLTSSGFYCISNCTPGTSGTINCNTGQCQLTLSGPQCL